MTTLPSRVEATCQTCPVCQHAHAPGAACGYVYEDGPWRKFRCVCTSRRHEEHPDRQTPQEPR